MSKGKILVIDLDGTLCDQEHIDSYHLAAPKPDVIRRVNELHSVGFRVIIFTARGMRTYGSKELADEKLRAMTTRWLVDHGVLYDELYFGKPPGDYYVDDKMISINDFIQLPLRGEPMKVFTNGCFDLLHRGHLSLLQYCRDLAGREGKVIVGLNSDDSVLRLKGPGRPIVSEDDRREMLLSNRNVDEVIIYDEMTPMRLLDEIRPDVIVKGAEYKESDVVGYGKYPVKLAPYMQGLSTTSLVSKARGNYCE